MSWHSQEQPKSGLRIPNTGTDTPTAVSPILFKEGQFCFWGKCFLLLLEEESVQDGSGEPVSQENCIHEEHWNPQGTYRLLTRRAPT
jgi:hypothetical protein